MTSLSDEPETERDTRAIISELCNSTILVVLAFAAGMILPAMFESPGDGDLWWQKWLGTVILQRHAIPTELGLETFTAVGAPWVAHEWLFSTLLAAAAAHGLEPAFAFVAGCCVFGALVVIAVNGLLRGASTLAVTLALLLALLGLLPSIGLRAQVVALILMSVYFAVTSRQGIRWWGVPIACCWANLHASALIAPVTIALLVIGDAIDRRRLDRRFCGLLSLLLATCAAILATPLTWHLPAYAIALLSSPIKANIVEWESPLAWSGNGVLFLLATVILIAIGSNQRRCSLRTFERLSLLAYYGLAMSAVRHLPLFFIYSLPIAASTITGSSRTAGADARRSPRLLQVAAAVAMLIAGSFVSTLGLSRRSVLPYDAVRYIETHAVRTRVYCADYSWCGMLVGQAGVRVYLDGRADPYPAPLWAENRRIVSGVGTIALLRDRHVNTVLVARADLLDKTLTKSRDWHLVYQDTRYLVYDAKR